MVERNVDKILNSLNIPIPIRSISSCRKVVKYSRNAQRYVIVETKYNKLCVVFINSISISSDV